MKSSSGKFRIHPKIFGASKRYTLLLCVACALVSFLTVPNVIPSPVVGNCIVNDALYESLLVPTKNDTIAYEGTFLKTYAHLPFGYSFVYEMLPLVRGLVDTAILSRTHFDRFQNIKPSHKIALALSPLIVEGEIESIRYDTSEDSSPKFYITTYIVRITDVMRTKYSIGIGTKVTARIHDYGYFRNWAAPDNGRVSYSVNPVITPYEHGRKYLFALNKYHYMYTMYLKQQKGSSMSMYDDVYCPYGFSLDATALDLSADYARGVITKDDVVSFLKLR